MTSDALANSSSQTKTQLAPWWKPRKLAEGQCWRYAIGPLVIYLQRHDTEWWLASEPSTQRESKSPFPTEHFIPAV